MLKISNFIIILLTKVLKFFVSLQTDHSSSNELDRKLCTIQRALYPKYGDIEKFEDKRYIYFLKDGFTSTEDFEILRSEFSTYANESEYIDNLVILIPVSYELCITMENLDVSDKFLELYKSLCDTRYFFLLI